MLLLLTDGFLLIFLTLSIGDIARALLEKMFRCRIPSDPLGILLLGLMLSSFYFNLFSFWLPVNQFALIPLAVISAGWLYRYERRETAAIYSIYRSAKYFIAPSRLLLTICVLAVAIWYFILPPSNGDSVGYHYLAVLWYEKYKVVPGLANVHTRFAYNPISFIIEAAYSFTGPTGQSIYPLNMVITGVFFFWLLKRLLKHIDRPVALAYLLIIILSFRLFLVYASCPTSDILLDACVLYSFIRLSELARERRFALPSVIVPILAILYAVMAKLTCVPLLLVLPVLYILVPKKDKGWSVLLKFFVLSLLLYVPWLIRNYIMSGYLVFPFPFLDVFHPDWKAPQSLLQMESYFFHNNLPPNGPDPFWHSSSPFIQAIESWASYFIQNRQFGDPALLLVALFSPFYWLFARAGTSKINTYAFLLWAVAYARIWIGLSIALTIRYVADSVLLAIALPFLALLSGAAQREPVPYNPQRKPIPYKLMVNVVLVLFTLHYLVSGYTKSRNYSFTIADCWLLPLKDQAYAPVKNEAGFPSRMLRPGIKLYIADNAHNCLNADLPCMVYPFGNIEMRGPRIEQGFRMTDVPEMTTYPFRP
jgi:hypothetical protein